MKQSTPGPSPSPTSGTEPAGIAALARGLAMTRSRRTALAKVIGATLGGLVALERQHETPAKKGKKPKKPKKPTKSCGKFKLPGVPCASDPLGCCPPERPICCPARCCPADLPVCCPFGCCPDNPAFTCGTEDPFKPCVNIYPA